MADEMTWTLPPAPKPNSSTDPARAPAPEIVAYSAWGDETKLVPAFKQREWMDKTSQRFAYHCLPMTLASQSGWFVLAPHGAISQWNGGDKPEDLTIKITGNPKSVQAQSAVGQGILTWTIPYLIRTSPGWNTLCRGPANYPKDGVAPLEGLVETDWSFASFSMNWRFTRPGTVEWAQGEPVAMLVPQRRAELESFACRITPLANNPAIDQGYKIWIEARHEFLQAQRNGDAEAIKKKFQKHYFQGETNSGVTFEGHQKSRDLRTFGNS